METGNVQEMHKQRKRKEIMVINFSEMRTEGTSWLHLMSICWNVPPAQHG